jgi:hypothetical protein
MFIEKSQKERWPRWWISDSFQITEAPPNLKDNFRFLAEG